MEKLQLRVERLEDDMKEVCSDVKTIMNNHLPHIQAEVARLSSTVKWIGGIIMIALTALIGMVMTQ